MKLIDMIETSPDIKQLAMVMYGSSAREVQLAAIKAERAFLILAKELADIDIRTAANADSRWHLDGFIVSIPGHHGDIAWHTATDYTYETYGTIVDADDCTRHNSAKEAVLALLATPENYEYREVSE